jgi:anti-sigma regulatory factor (Ser/Thr protein kinase)
MTCRILAAVQSRLAIAHDSDIGECRRQAKRRIEGYGFDEVSAGRISIAATELATNIVRHAGHGEILMQVLDDGIHPEFEMLAIDKGPGMLDVDACMRDGFSTGGTAGQGLGAVSRLSGTFDIFSAAGQGTVVLSRIGRNQNSRPTGGALATSSARPTLEFGAISLAVAGEIECGDIWRIADAGLQVGILVADGLGHGPLAATAAKAAADAFVKRPFEAPSLSMQGLHRAVTGTRGAAAACALLQAAELRVEYAGVGNICGAVITGERSRGMVSHNGTLGVQLLRTQQFDYDWPMGARIVMHSDGLSARWSLATYPGLLQRHSAVIAGVLYRDFSRQRDDATVVVVCQRA